jgi:hypothetical protein
MPLSQLAANIYDVLRDNIRTNRATITYSELVKRLGPLPAPNRNLQAQDRRLNEALNELVQYCRERNLSAISAIVVTANTARPGPGYYDVAYPELSNGNHSEEERAWLAEVSQVYQTHYPETL